MLGARVLSGDGDVVEEAEAQGAGGLGVTAGRPHPAKGVGDLASHHRVGRPQHRAHAVIERAERAGGHRRVAIEIGHAPLGRRLADHLDIGGGMHPADRVVIRFGRLFARQAGEDLVPEHLIDGAHAVRALRMAGAGIMVEEARMRDVQGRHW